jgi:hypothetical protein
MIRGITCTCTIAILISSLVFGAEDYKFDNNNFERGTGEISASLEYAVAQVRTTRVTSAIGDNTMVRNSALTGWVDVRAFGAKGDGVTDDTAAIQAAIDSIVVGTVYFPPGKFLLKSIFLRNKKVNLRGASSGYDYQDTNSASVLKFTGGTKGIAFFPESGLNMEEGAFIADLTIDGNNVIDYGIWMATCGIIERVTVKGTKVAGIYLYNLTNQVHIINSSITSNYGDGIYVLGHFTTPFTVKNSNIRWNKGNGVYISSGYFYRFQDCVIESNLKYGVWIRKIYSPQGYFGDRGLFANCWFEANNSSKYGANTQVYIGTDTIVPNDNNTTGNKFYRCVFSPTSPNGNYVYVDSANDTMFDECAFGGSPGFARKVLISSRARRTTFRSCANILTIGGPLENIVLDNGTGTIGIRYNISAFQGGWASSSLPYGKLSLVRTDNENVEISGSAFGGRITDGATVFNIPVGYLTSYAMDVFTAQALDNTGKPLGAVIVTLTGNSVRIYKAPANTYRIFFNGIKYRVEF